METATLIQFFDAYNFGVQVSDTTGDAIKAESLPVKIPAGNPASEKYSTFGPVPIDTNNPHAKIMQQILPIAFSILASIHCFCQDTISITQFGYEPGSRQNAVPFVAKAIEQCKTKAHAVLIFPKGRYDFWPQYCAESLNISKKQQTKRR